MTTGIQVTRLFALSFLCTVALAAQSQNDILTKPTHPKLAVPKPPPPIQLTIPNQPPSVPPQMPVVEHEEHMAFQKTEDALGNKIDLLDQKVDGFKKTLDADHTDVEGLKETRTVVKVWGSVLVAAWSLVLFLGFKEKLVALFHRIVGVQGVLSNGAIAINADAASSTKTPPPPQE